MKKIRYTYIIYCIEPKSSYYGCIYYGQHTTDNLLDGYITSGKLIGRYIKKYPNGYYRKILGFYNTEEELNKAEEQLIAPHLGQSYCLNLVGGGTCRSMPGKLNPMYGKRMKDYMSEEAYKEMHRKQGESLRKTNMNKSPEQRKQTDLARKHMSENHADVSGEKNPMYGKNIKDYMTPEAYEEMLEKQKIALSNRTWINNGVTRKFIKIEEVEKYINLGWKLGYKIGNEKKRNHGKSPWNKDKKTGPQSEETRRKRSESMKKYWQHLKAITD